jgi:peptidyl-prolyl cis-trans isomerase SurA
VLERLIVENLQLQIGERSGIRITDEELNQAVGTIAQRNNMSGSVPRRPGPRRPVL